MDEGAIAELEARIGLKFPTGYRNALLSCGIDPSSEEFCRIPAELIRSNDGLREFAPPELGWSGNHWWIGDDGSGGFHFLDLTDPESTVLYYDHEVPPEHPNDRERLKPQTLDAFLASCE
jgi:hypothetical protein